MSTQTVMTFIFASIIFGALKVGDVRLGTGFAGAIAGGLGALLAYIVAPSSNSHKKRLQKLAGTINSNIPVDSRYKFNPSKNNKSTQAESIKSNADSKLGLAGEIEAFANLRDKGVITDEEFQEQKKRLLS
jgi:hypothetical protein